jgi:hypothetical protein
MRQITSRQVDPELRAAFVVIPAADVTTVGSGNGMHKA